MAIETDTETEMTEVVSAVKIAIDQEALAMIEDTRNPRKIKNIRKIRESQENLSKRKSREKCRLDLQKLDY